MRAACLGVVLVFTGAALWGGTPIPMTLKGYDQPSTVAVHGQRGGGGLYCVEMAVNQIAQPQRYPDDVIIGIELYSEPSHTLVAAYTEPSAASGTPALARATGPMGGTVPLLCTQEPLPAGDSAVIVMMLTPRGPRRIANMGVNLADFALSVTLNSVPDMPPVEICCVCQGCRHCVDFTADRCGCICPGCHMNCSGGGGP